MEAPFNNYGTKTTVGIRREKVCPHNQNVAICTKDEKKSPKCADFRA